MAKKKTMEEYSQQVWEKCNRTVYVIPGQEYINTDTKLWHYCTIHNIAYHIMPHSVLDKRRNTGCPECKKHSDTAQLAKANTQDLNDFIGQTTPDGHLVLEYVEHKKTPSDIKRNRCGAPVYRYKCGNCGDDTHTARRDHLKRKGYAAGCKSCHTKRESIERHLRNKKRALEPCQFYIADVYFGDYLKIGISKNYEQRAAAGNSGNPYYDSSLTPEEHYHAGNLDLAYEHCWFLSEPYPRAWIFSIEQIILRASEMHRPTKPIPKEMIEVLWSGQTELRDWHMGNEVIENAFHKLLKMIQDADGDWYQVYCQQFGKFVLG